MDTIFGKKKKKFKNSIDIIVFNRFKIQQKKKTNQIAKTDAKICIRDIRTFHFQNKAQPFMFTLHDSTWRQS